MPTIQAQGQTFECETGANLRQVLLAQGIALYNDAAAVINCHGISTCGTCAVSIVGNVSAMGWRERSRLALPPHHVSAADASAPAAAGDRRLACQVKVLGDLAVTKYDGFWGQGTQPVWTPSSRVPEETTTPDRD